jgi:phosphatidylinositol 3-kinase
VEDKHRRLIRSHRSSPHDRSLKPNAKIRDELAKILSYAPSQPLNSEEKDQIWKFRFYLSRDKRGLTKFLKSVTWRDQSEVKQAVEELLPQWAEIDIDDALELLGPGTVDSRVRAYAVKQLNRADDDELLLYLLQLVQALKFESTASDQRSSRITSSAVSYEDSGLADFLITRAVKNPILSNRFHWYLMVEVADQVMAKMYGRVIYKFQQRIAEVSSVRGFFGFGHLWPICPVGRRGGATRVDETAGPIDRGAGEASKRITDFQRSATEEDRKAPNLHRRLEE